MSNYTDEKHKYLLDGILNLVIALQQQLSKEHPFAVDTIEGVKNGYKIKIVINKL